MEEQALVAEHPARLPQHRQDRRLRIRRGRRVAGQKHAQTVSRGVHRSFGPV